MTKTIFALILALTAASAGATTWPWQDSAPQEPLDYCKGFVVGGLASKQVSGMSRTDLWLAWSYAIRSGPVGQAVASSEFQTGLQQFQDVPDTTAAMTIVQEADGDCGLGRSGHEITGW
jgi:hypothetical protein